MESPADLARSAGLPDANLTYNFLSGRGQSLRLVTIRQICKGPGMSIGELLDDHWWQRPSGGRFAVCVRGKHRDGDIAIET